MSIAYWSVTGIGINFEEMFFSKDLNPKKVFDLLEIEVSEIDDRLDLFRYDLDINEVLEMIIAKCDKRNLLHIGNTGNMDQGVFLLHGPSYSWNLTDETKNLKKIDIENYITDILKKISNIPEGDIRKKIEEVYLPGCG